MAEDISNPVGAAPATQRQASGVVVPHRARWYQRLAARLIWLVIQCVSATLRYRLNDPAGHFAASRPTPFIVTVWHNRLALSLVLYNRYVRRHTPERRLAAIVSASKDGGLLARILELFEVEPVRGSSSRRGPQALRELVSWGERGFDLAITPDGPRGPCYEVQEGVISAAQLTGLAIVPVAYNLNWKIRLKSWDRFQIPLPFARCEVVTGSPMRVPREATEAERENFRVQLQTAIRALTRD